MEPREPEFESDDADDGQSYPLAPLPAHERRWRHPSEVGQSDWLLTEPPVAIGRSLMVTTGAIGSVLGVAILWLMLPAGHSAPSAAPIATASVATLRAAPVVSAVAAAPPVLTAPTPPVPATTLVASTLLAPRLPSPDVPSTVLVISESAADHRSFAVAIEGDPYVITTASAVSSPNGLRLLGPGDSTQTPTDAEVVSIEGQLAYLAPSTSMDVVTFSAVAHAGAGQVVTVLGDEPIAVAFAADGGIPELDARIVVEGTPVVDADGALVALCTVIIDADGAYVDLVPLVTEQPSNHNEPDPTSPVPPASAPTTVDQGGADEPGTGTGTGSSDGAKPGGASDSTTNGSPPGSPTPEPQPAVSITPIAWAGVRFDGAPPGAPLTITGIVPDSPAALAGLAVGDRIVALDGVTVDSVDGVLAAIRRYQPGQTMRVTVITRPAGSTPGATVAAPAGSTSEKSVSVVLGVFVPTG